MGGLGLLCLAVRLANRPTAENFSTRSCACGTSDGYRHNTPVGWAIRVWSNLNSRTNNGQHPSPKAYPHYLDKGVRLDMCWEDFKLWVISHWYEVLALRADGEKASIDRIDSSRGYSLDNIRILSLRQNCRAGELATAAKRAMAKMQALV